MSELTVTAQIQSIDTVTDFINEELDAIECPFKARAQIDIAIDELFGNIARYAYYPETGEATVKFELEKDPDAVKITFIDEGIPYDPMSVKDPDITLSAEKRPLGGLGIYMVKKSMDEMIYEYKGGKNILTIKKYI